MNKYYTNIPVTVVSDNIVITNNKHADNNKKILSSWHFAYIFT